MNFKANESATKLRGGYYTPIGIASFLLKWALLKNPKNILEPSCGDGSFITAMENNSYESLSFTGIEILEQEADKSRQAAILNKDLDAEVLNEDFLEWSYQRLNGHGLFDAVVGNPPYIRYQYLEKRDQEYSEKIFAKYDLAFTKHTNAWVPFVISSVGLLNAGGRLAMVIPSEILHVLHANSLRKFLLRECSRILIIDPNELLFEKALQGTILLLIEKKERPSQETKGVAIVSAPNNDFLAQDPEAIFDTAKYVSGDVLNGKWMKVLLDPEALEVFERVKNLDSVYSFQSLASVDVGIVTGANKFFLVSDATVKEFGLEEYVNPMFGRSEHCPGIVYDSATHAGNQLRGLPTNFVNFGNAPIESLSKGARKYIVYGELQDLHTRYKCRIRKPWYSVPSISSSPMGMLKRCHNYPRLILNTANAYTTDTAYRIRPLKQGLKPEALVYSFINSLTALTAELEGRHYGGGVLELVPSEIEKLLVPISDHIRVDLEQLDSDIRKHTDADQLLKKQDEIVLKVIGISDKDRAVIHDAWRKVRIRRHRLLGDPI
jgi:adenine-specific DNA-methyltransferase